MSPLELVTASDVASWCAVKIKTLATLADYYGASTIDVKGIWMILADYTKQNQRA